jgi:hypothetical protein
MLALSALLVLSFEDRQDYTFDNKGVFQLYELVNNDKSRYLLTHFYKKNNIMCKYIHTYIHTTHALSRKR